MEIDNLIIVLSSVGGMAGFLWVYLRLTRGTGVISGVFLSLMVLVVGYKNPVVGRYLAVIFIFSVALVEVWVQLKKRKFSYSHLTYEGGGIRRGLSPPEAGALFDLPISALFVLGMVELLQKGFIRYIWLPDGGLVVKPAEDFLVQKKNFNPKARREARKEAAFERTQELTISDDILLEIFEQNMEQALGEYSIQIWVDYLHQKVGEEFSEYDFAQTKQYYRDYIKHRFRGIQKGFFSSRDYIGWLFLSLFAGNNFFTSTNKILTQTRPHWIDEGESLINWLKAVKSVEWQQNY
jgi:hypothetical protein